MARLFTVVVMDDKGQQVGSKDVDLDLLGTNGEEADLSDFEKAAYLAAPEVCPFDCDHCRD